MKSKKIAQIKKMMKKYEIETISISTV